MTTDRPQPPADAPSSDEDIPVPLGEVLEFLRLIWALDHRIQQASKRIRMSGLQKFETALGLVHDGLQIIT